MTQYLLVEGLAALALTAVLTGLGRASRRPDAGALGRTAMLVGISAALVSLHECVLGLWLAAVAAPDGQTSRVGMFFGLINYLDGVTMLAFAVMALAAIVLGRRGGALPHWLGYLGAALAAAMTASGIGYLLLNKILAMAAAASPAAAADLGAQHRPGRRPAQQPSRRSAS